MIFFYGEKGCATSAMERKIRIILFSKQSLLFLYTSIGRKNCSTLVLGNSNFFDPFEEEVFSLFLLWGGSTLSCFSFF